MTNPVFSATISPMKSKRIAIVTDWLTDRGGAEHVNMALAEMFPGAVIFTSVFTPEAFPELKGREVRTTWLQKLPAVLRKKHQMLLPFFPRAFEKLNLSEFDLIISSSSSGFSKCVKKTRPEQAHICYCHTPVRFLYHARQEYVKEYPLPWFLKPFKWTLPLLLDVLTKKDQAAAKNVDYFLANSDFVGKRVKEFYHRDAKTIYPCVDTESFLKAKKSPPPPFTKGAETPERKNPPAPLYPFATTLRVNFRGQEYFLALGRFIPYKKFDLLVETFAKNKLPLKLVGSGPDLARCKDLAEKLGAKNIEFLGFAQRETLPMLYAKARAFLFPAEEDFGLTPVEAMCSGTPVIYFGKGGAVESVGKWGISFAEQTPVSLQKGIEEFLTKEKTFDPEALRKRGAEFDVKVFQGKVREFLLTSSPPVGED